MDKQTSRGMELGAPLAKAVIAVLGETYLSTRYLETGSTSAAFLVTTATSQYVLKVAVPRAGKSASYDSDFTLRQTLWEQGEAVAKPVATDQSFATGLAEKWALDEFKSGAAAIRGGIEPPVSRQLGQLLRAVHSLAVSGYGQFENNRGPLTGSCSTPVQGLLSRLESPWPFTDIPLERNPAIAGNSQLVERLRPLQTSLTALVAESTPTAIHSDLHEGQLLVSDGQLMALIDFNDAISGSSAWDFGSYLYFHGNKRLSDLLDGYSSDPSEKICCAEKGFLASIMIALHHGNRGAILGRPDRIDTANRFLVNQFS